MLEAFAGFGSFELREPVFLLIGFLALPVYLSLIHI